MDFGINCGSASTSRGAAIDHPRCDHWKLMLEAIDTLPNPLVGADLAEAVAEDDSLGLSITKAAE
jgi:hypothetical protein